ncbi:MAG TPA: hypothetical protein VGA17_12000 [Nitrospiraceae bacterium]|jgi:hypothetical protein
MTTLMRCCFLIVGCAVFWTAGCNHDKSKPYELGDVPDTRIPIHLPAEADRAHREVMMMHLETVQVLMAALADEDFKLALGVTEAHLGFFARRHVAAQHAPPAYRDLAAAHYRAGQELAKIIPSRDIKQILPRFNSMLATCVACHLEFRSEGTRSH